MGNKFIKTAKNFYDQWRKEVTYCPAFKSNIVISLRGWWHITGHGGAKKRIWNDVYRRIKLLQHAKDIIKTATTIQSIENINSQTYYALDAMRLIDMKGSKVWMKVRVVLVEDKYLRKVFLSVMSVNKTKKPQKGVLTRSKYKVPHALVLRRQRY